MVNAQCQIKVYELSPFRNTIKQIQCHQDIYFLQVLILYFDVKHITSLQISDVRRFNLNSEKIDENKPYDNLCILLILNSMNCSIDNYYPDQLNEGLDNIHQERLHSLELQIESLIDFQPHIAILKDILNQHRDCKIVRGRSLLEQQHKLMNRQEKENQLNRYYCRIRQLQQSIKIKEQDMWQQSLNGKRVRNIALHREAINIFHHEERQTETIFSQLTKRDQLLKQIAKLQVLLKKQEPLEDHQNYYMEGIDTTLLKIIMDEEQIECQLQELEESLKDELRQEGNKQIELIQKYQELSSQKMNKNVGQIQETDNRETSSKTISTQGQQSQF